MSVRAVVLIVDALGWQLAHAAPDFAPSLGSRRRIETVLGFSSGALPTLFTGQPPSAHGRWLMYRRAEPGTASAFRGFGWLGLLPERARRSWSLSRLLTRVVARRGVRGYFNLYEVPRDRLELFDLPERDDIFAPGGLPVDSLWDSIARRGLRWAHWDWRTPEAEAFSALERKLRDGDERLLVCYTADLDALLHREGSAGRGVRERLERYGAWIERLESLAARRGDTLRLYLMSDHGMVDVARHVDAIGPLRPLAARPWRDYTAFFDSTFARFWWHAPAVREPVRAALAGLPGHWLSEDELAREGCRFAHAEYGEDLFLLDPGVLMVPSFMGRGAVAAMHGYTPAHPDMAALLWSNRPVPESVTRLTDVRGYLESELDALAGEAA